MTLFHLTKQVLRGVFMTTALAALPAAQAEDIPTPVTLIQMGDIHGHLIARPNLRSDGTGALEGGLSRMHTKVGQIRAANPGATLLFNTGDTLQGSAEALFSAGQAMVNVLNQFNIDAYAPGNWDFTYGTTRFTQFFSPLGPPNPAGAPPLVKAAPAAWGAVAANLYYTDELPLFADHAGERVLPPYLIKQVNGLRIGIIGLTSGDSEMNKQPATDGLEFTTDGHELPEFIATLRDVEQVDLVVLISEFGLAKNIVLAEKYPGLDVILSSDTHEETTQPVVTKTGTLISEAGQDGTQIAELKLNVLAKKIVTWNYQLHTIVQALPESPLAGLINQVRSSFVTGPAFTPKLNPINQTMLTQPIDTPVGQATANLYRGNFSQQPMPGVIEGSSSDLLAEAFRDQAGTDIGQIRGFRYGTHVAAAGFIRVEDLYHYMGAGAQIARINVPGWMLKYQIEFTADQAFYPDPMVWGGGWLPAYAGVRFKLDPAAAPGLRSRDIQVYDRVGKVWRKLDPLKKYSYAGYFFDIRPDVVGGMPVLKGETVTLVTGPNGERLDATQVVMNYLAGHSGDPGPARVTQVAPLPAPLFGFPEVQPLRGVCPRVTFGCQFTIPPVPDISDLF
jgi:sulfur-oxidizing protein SoxB